MMIIPQGPERVKDNIVNLVCIYNNIHIAGRKVWKKFYVDLLKKIAIFTRGRI